MPSHNCIIITMFSFQGAAESLLRNSMKFLVSKELQSISYDSFGWWRLAGSNRWPPACKAGALPAELNPHIHFVEVVGQGLAFLRESHGGCNSPPDCCQEPPFESILALHAFRTQLPRSWLLFQFLEVVGQNGLEPSTSRLSVVCSSQLSYWPIFGLLHFCGTFTLYPLNWIMWNLTLCTDL